MAKSVEKESQGREVGRDTSLLHGPSHIATLCRRSPETFFFPPQLHLSSSPSYSLVPPLAPIVDSDPGSSIDKGIRHGKTFCG